MKPNVIVVCADALIIRKSGSLLLGVREIEPVKGLPWIIGGRVQKGMAMELAVHQQVLKETGLQSAVVAQSGIYRRVYKAGEDRDDLVFTYVVMETGGELRQDFQHSRFVEVSGYGDEKYSLLHERVRQPIMDSGIFEEAGGRTVASILRDKSAEYNKVLSRSGVLDSQAHLELMLRGDYVTLKRSGFAVRDDVTPL